MMCAALHSFGDAATSDQLRNFFWLKENEKENVLLMYREIFHELHINSDGEIDPVIDSVLNPKTKDEDQERNAIRISEIMYGDDMHVYHINAYTSAISCAEELGMFDISELLHTCLDSTVFAAADLEFLRKQEEKLLLVPKHVAAA